LIRKKKVPAYGAALRERRRGGEHPLCVHLIYGFTWNKPCECWYTIILPGEHPRLALKPEDYAPGLYDFSVVAGVQVCVFDQDSRAQRYESPDYGPARPRHFYLYALLGELAWFAADVELHSPALDMATSAFRLARQQHRRGRELNDGWPFWWSTELEEKNGRQRETWCRAAGLVQEAAREFASA
jgi:hypothetical protein